MKRTLRHSKISTWVSLSMIVFFAVLNLRCAEEIPFNEGYSSEYFVQSFNPAFVDILWVVDTRTPMRLVKSNLLSQATSFFTQLDSETANYRMGFITPDMETNNGMGQLQPSGLSGNKIITKNLGDLNQRISLFQNLFPLHTFNLSTGAESRGFEAAKQAFVSQFTTQSNVPLVIVFVSDGDDTSKEGDVDFYKEHFKSLKGGDDSLLRIYSINYTETGDRCATSAANTKTDFTDYRYKDMAEAFNGVLADVCEPFASQIDYDPIRFKQLQSRFQLANVPQLSTLTVRVVEPVSGSVIEIPYTYDSNTNEIVFSSIPPEGSRVEVNYLAAGA